jgi:hypothetical protein
MVSVAVDVAVVVAVLTTVTDGVDTIVDVGVDVSDVVTEVVTVDVGVLVIVVAGVVIAFSPMIFFSKLMLLRNDSSVSLRQSSPVHNAVSMTHEVNGSASAPAFSLLPAVVAML